MPTPNPETIDQYIAAFPAGIQEILQQVRDTIKKAAPGAEETIKYGMPTFMLDGNLAYFAAWKNHIGFYPAPTGNKDFEKDLAGYKTGRGSVQFPLDKPIPLKLITKIVKYQAQQNKEKAALKKAKKGR